MLLGFMLHLMFRCSNYVKKKRFILFIKKQEKGLKMVTFESEMKQGRFAPFLRKKI